MTRWTITYYGGGQQMKTATIEAPTAADALTMFDVNVMCKRINQSSAGPYVGDVATIVPAKETDG